VYQGQKVHLFRPSLSFLAEAQPRLEIGADRRHFLAEMHINFLSDRTTSKTFEKITNYFVSTFFKYICFVSTFFKYLNLLTHITDFPIFYNNFLSASHQN
jgi:hypothetical protein